MTFSASDAAFEGFRLTREKPAAVAAWALVQLVAGVVVALLTVFLIGPEMKALLEFNQNPPSDPAAVQAILPAMFKVLGVGAPIRMLAWAVMVCAVYRAVLRPQDKGFGYLRLGADEVRQVLLSIVIFLIMMAAVAVVTFGLVMVAMGLALLAGGNGGSAGTMAMMVTLVSMFAIVGVYVWLLVRLSLTGPMTLMRGKLSIGEGWAMTKGHFWKLLGAYFIAFILAVVVALLGWAIILAVSLAVGGGFGVMGQLQNPDFSSLETAFSPTMIAMMICSSVLAALQLAILIAPTAVVYRALSGEGAVDTFA